MERSGQQWSSFVKKQQTIIIKRIEKYKNVDTAVESLKETRDLSHYQYYKSSTVSKYLLRAMDKIEEGSYGLCDVCKEEIPIRRLEIVPGTLNCVKCDEKKLSFKN
jgi:DnaK suppressor protein